jgi:hypothetical protein
MCALNVKAAHKSETAMAGQEKVLVINEKKLCRDIESKKKWAK